MTPVIDIIEDIKPHIVSDLIETIEKYGTCYLTNNDMVFNIDSELFIEYNDYELDNISKIFKSKLRNDKISFILQDI